MGPFMRYVRKYGTAGQSTGDSIMRRMRFACRITKATHTYTHTHNIWYLLLFHGSNGYVNALQCYVLRILPVLFKVCHVLGNMPATPMRRFYRHVNSDLNEDKVLHWKGNWFVTPSLHIEKKNYKRQKKPEQYVNLLKPTGHVMHQQFSVQQLYALPTLYLCVLYLSENKQRLVPLTA